jgi:hypothetical protein
MKAKSLLASFARQSRKQSLGGEREGDARPLLLFSALETFCFVYKAAANVKGERA